jgi:hypothetical protein
MLVDEGERMTSWGRTLWESKWIFTHARTVLSNTKVVKTQWNLFRVNCSEDIRTGKSFILIKTM